MKIKELIETFSKLDPNQEIMIEGYEGGWEKDFYVTESFYVVYHPRLACGDYSTMDEQYEYINEDTPGSIKIVSLTEGRSELEIELQKQENQLPLDLEV